MRREADVVWTGQALDAGGFGSEIRDIVLALDQAGVAVHLDPWDHRWATRLSDGSAERLERLVALEAPEHFAHVIHAAPERVYRHPRALLSVARLMYETDRVPELFVDAAQLVDEVWVPTAFNAATFARSGVPPEKIHVVPEGLDEAAFEPMPPAFALGVDGFVFLSVFSWQRRKAWDVLVQAFAEEFAAHEPVTLMLKTTSSTLRDRDRDRREFESLLRTLGEKPDGRRIRLLERDPGDAGMPRLYAAASAFVLASRGEGWGRPLMEAMAAGLPTIGTGWGGNTAFMNDENSYLVEYELVDVDDLSTREHPGFAGHRWAEPSHEHLRSTMRRVFEERGEAASRAERGRRDVLENFNRAETAAAIVQRLEDAGVRVRRTTRPRHRVHRVMWEGPQFKAFGLATVNRDLSRALLGTKRVDLELIADEPVDLDPRLSALFARTSARTALPRDVWVRHSWPPDFSRPPSGKLVVVLPWEWGWLPTEWLDPLQDVVDEVWVPTTFVRDAFIRSGVDADRVVVVPNGVDPLRFHRAVPPLRLPTRKRFKFLFVGGALWRKGADVLLETYLETFGRRHDVCLVVRDLGAKTFYRGQTLRDEFRRAQRRPRGPEILYLDNDLVDADLPSLYAACDCLVHPYRAEGFALPVAEAMAAGLPVIVPDRGACRDYCDEDVAYLVPAVEHRADVARVGDVETVAPPEWVEVDRRWLQEAMIDVFRQRDEARALGKRGSEHVLRNVTWQRAADVALRRLDALASRPARRPRPRKTLSVCLIVKNEAAQLERALESVRGVADEIVVVDTGSDDGTPELAANAGARVSTFEWTDDFAAARNESLRLATCDWILALDADHELEPDSRDELRSVIQTDAVRGFILRFRNFVGDTPEVVENFDLRLFPNHPSIRFENAVHEQIFCADPNLELERVITGIALRHYGTRSDPAKAERYARMLEKLLLEFPRSAYAAANLGSAYATIGDSDNAEQAFRRAIELSSGRRDAVSAWHHVTSYTQLARLQLEAGRSAEALENARRAARLDPDFFDARLLLATAELRLGHTETAYGEFKRAARSRHGVPWNATVAPAAWRAHVGAAEALARLGDLAAAGLELAAAERAAPGHPVVVDAVERLEALRNDSSGTMSRRRGAGAVERGGLENR